MNIMHVGLLVSDLSAAGSFYGDILGLEMAERPDLGFPGLFFDLAGGQQIHLMQLDNPYRDCSRPAHGGRDRHVALSTDDLNAIRNKLDAAHISYTLSKSGRAALFTRDPDGNVIELCETV
ncbi:MAG: VOC family protein [Mariprofundaceae bacterium]|nr:VOC family protein [Mariprofundaceae bacterium]